MEELCIQGEPEMQVALLLHQGRGEGLAALRATKAVDPRHRITLTRPTVVVAVCGAS